jgi:serine protease Do
MSSKARDLVKLSLIIAAAFGVGLSAAAAFDLPRSGVAEAPRPTDVTARAPATAAAARSASVLPSFADIVDRINPSVVFVRTDRVERRTPRMRGLPPGFEEFFREPGGTEPRHTEGAGSGFIVSRDGYILTNNHVVEGAASVRVQLIDNRVFDARVVGRDPNTDVAVIKITASDLPAVTFGNSDGARIGDWVLAIGNPLGFAFTVTAGIVSAKGRTLSGLIDANQRYTIQDFIQTDAAINPGNSGGPLVDMDGRVVGINSAIASSTGLNAGYGFAVPINLARRVMDDLIRTGRVDRAILGVSIKEITPEDAEYVGLREIRGVRVDDFSSGNSPARAAGILQGDIIVALNDTPVTHVAQLQQMVGFKRAGEVVRVTVVRREGDRANVRRTLDVRLIAAPSDNTVASNEDDGDPSKASPVAGKLGIQVQAIPPDVARRSGLRDEVQGVVVTNVEAGGPAWNRLLPYNQTQYPDVILFVNQTRVRTVDEFERAVRAVQPGAVVSLTVASLSQEPTQRVVRIRARR